jgi:hypothetical protein
MSADVFAEDGYFAVIPEWVLDADISAQAIRLYAVLRRYADQRTREAHPSRRTLAGRLHVVDLKVVDRALADLVSIGAVEVFERMTEAGDRDANGYMIKGQPQLSSQGGGRNHPTGRGRNLPRVGVETPQQEREPLNESQRNESSSSAAIAAGAFEEFWLHYPRKIGKLAAEKAWRKAIKSTDPYTIIAAVKSYAFPADRQFVPHPATWLNAGRWMDEQAKVDTRQPWERFG